MEPVLIVLLVGLILMLLLETYSYRNFVKASDALSKLGEAFQEAFAVAVNDMAKMSLRLQEIESRESDIIHDVLILQELAQLHNTALNLKHMQELISASGGFEVSQPPDV